MAVFGATPQLKEISRMQQGYNQVLSGEGPPPAPAPEVSPMMDMPMGDMVPPMPPPPPPLPIPGPEGYPAMDMPMLPPDVGAFAQFGGPMGPMEPPGDRAMIEALLGSTETPMHSMYPRSHYNPSLMPTGAASELGEQLAFEPFYRGQDTRYPDEGLTPEQMMAISEGRVPVVDEQMPVGIYGEGFADPTFSGPPPGSMGMDGSQSLPEFLKDPIIDAQRNIVDRPTQGLATEVLGPPGDLLKNLLGDDTAEQSGYSTDVILDNTEDEDRYAADLERWMTDFDSELATLGLTATEAGIPQEQAAKNLIRAVSEMLVIEDEDLITERQLKKDKQAHLNSSILGDDALGRTLQNQLISIARNPELESGEDLFDVTAAPLGLIDLSINEINSLSPIHRKRVIENMLEEGTGFKELDSFSKGINKKFSGRVGRQYGRDSLSPKSPDDPDALDGGLPSDAGDYTSRLFNPNDPGIELKTGDQVRNELYKIFPGWNVLGGGQNPGAPGNLWLWEKPGEFEADSVYTKVYGEATTENYQNILNALALGSEGDVNMSSRLDKEFGTPEAVFEHALDAHPAYGNMSPTQREEATKELVSYFPTYINHIRVRDFLPTDVDEADTKGLIQRATAKEFMRQLLESRFDVEKVFEDSREVGTTTVARDPFSQIGITERKESPEPATDTGLIRSAYEMFTPDPGN